MRAMLWWRSSVRNVIYAKDIILSNKYLDENFGKFFEALGEGSMEEIAEDDGDDEETSKMSKK